MSNTTTTTTQQHQQQPPPEVQLFQYINGYQVTQITFTLTKLNIPDHLKNGPKTCKTLSNEINVPENELFRLLRAANALGLLSYHCDTQTFHLTELSTLLTESHPKSLKSATLMFGSEHYFAFGNLFKSIENGKSAFSQYYNGKTYFEYLETNKESAKVFDKTMTSFTNSFKETFVESLSDFLNHFLNNFLNNQNVIVVDVGGGEGQLVGCLLENYKNLNGIVMDLPQVIESYNYTNVSYKERLTTKAGSFFNENDVPEGDIYLLKTILHDWGDDACHKILTNIKQAILKRRKVLNNQNNNNQKIFVIEHLIPEKIKEKDPQSIVPCLLDLNMLVMCEGGKERTESEFKELFEKCGFKLKRVIPTKSRFVIIEGELSD